MEKQNIGKAKDTSTNTSYNWSELMCFKEKSSIYDTHQSSKWVYLSHFVPFRHLKFSLYPLILS